MVGSDDWSHGGENGRGWSVVHFGRWYILGGGVVQIKVKGIEDGGDVACFSAHALCSAQRRVYAIYALGRMCDARVWVCVRLACLCWAHKGDESLKSRWTANSQTCGINLKCTNLGTKMASIGSIKCVMGH